MLRFLLTLDNEAPLVSSVVLVVAVDSLEAISAKAVLF